MVHSRTIAARCGTSKAEIAVNCAQSEQFPQWPGDYSPFIDSPFAGSPIKNCLHRAHLFVYGDTGLTPVWLCNGRISMINKSKLALIAALLAMSVASPTLAQSFDKSDGTGNSLPFAYGPGGTHPTWTFAPQNKQIAARPNNAGRVAVRQTGRNTFAAVPGRGLYDYATVPFGSGFDAANSPAATGGGSTGYNEMLLRD
jgi:hypothetical protein